MPDSEPQVKTECNPGCLAIDSAKPDNCGMEKEEQQRQWAMTRERLALALEEARAKGDTAKTKAALARYCDVSEPAVGKWFKKGQVSGPNLHKAAQFFGKTVEWLLGGDANNVRRVKGSRRAIPLINYVQAGNPREVIDDYAAGAGMEYIFLDDDTADEYGPYTFALEIEGESMLDEFKPGDRIIVDSELQPLPGDFVVARIGTELEATFKKYRPRGKDAGGIEVFELVPLNEDYPTIVVSADHPGIIIGTMVEHRRRRRTRR